MAMTHMMKYHLLLPLAVFLVLLMVGVSLGTALIVGMMSGCLAMMLPRGRGRRSATQAQSSEDEQPRRP